MKPSIDPVVWTPPPLSARARYATGAQPLPELTLVPLPFPGEDVALDASGDAFIGLEDGSIVRVVRSDDRPPQIEVLVNTGGRPLGVEVAPDGALIVCDAQRGVLRVDPAQKEVEVLVDAVSRDLRLCNNAAVARDGSIYFSDSSRHFSFEHWMGEVLEHSGTGRLLRRAPNGKVEVLLDGLEFANGVALAADESFVAVAELGAYRIVRLWLSGPRSGEREILLDDIPGFADNIASDADGLIWIAVVSPRNALLDFLHRSPPIFRRALWALPDALKPKPGRTISVMAIDQTGRIVHDFAGEHPHFQMVSGVRVANGQMHLVSLLVPALAIAPISSKV